MLHSKEKIQREATFLRRRPHLANNNNLLQNDKLGNTEKQTRGVSVCVRFLCLCWCCRLVGLLFSPSLFSTLLSCYPLINQFPLFTSINHHLLSFLYFVLSRICKSCFRRLLHMHKSVLIHLRSIFISFADLTRLYDNTLLGLVSGSSSLSLNVLSAVSATLFY